MADKDKGPLTRIYVTVAKNGFEIEASYEPKKTLSQKKGWVPSPYCEPDKYVVNTKAQLTTKISELLKDCKECSK
jgi:hypothetical protein